MSRPRDDRDIEIAAFLPDSRANGPGRRAVVWVQGCTLGCHGCFNPETHPRAGGERVAVDVLAARIGRLGDAIEGVTISGGEPLQQWVPVLALLRAIRGGTGLSTIVFTGFRCEEVAAMPGAADFLANVDVLIAGRFEADRRVARGLVGSRNKTVHFLTDRYREEDLRDVPEAEVLISADGEVVMTGIDPLRWEEDGPEPSAWGWRR